MRQDQVLLVADPHLAGAIAFGEVGDEFHLVGGGVARRAADGLQRERDDGVAADAVGEGVLLDPGGERRIAGFGALEHDACRRARRQIAGGAK